MANSFSSFCSPVVLSSVSTTRFSALSSGAVYNEVGLRRGCLKFRTLAKFDKFQGEEVGNDSATSSSSSPGGAGGVTGQVVDDYVAGYEEIEEDDSCLPSDLEGAVRQSGIASATFVSSGGLRAMVELLVPQLQFLDEEGAQAELWELSRVFLDTLIEETGCQRVRAVFPDAGAAALLQYRWAGAAFGFSSLSDRKPVQAEDEIVVMVVPDYQMLEYVEKIASGLSDDPPRPLIMWNPRLVSEDVGVGFNVRKLMRNFLSKFTAVYYMRPLPSGAVFRCYPGLWKVFYDDKDRKGRYLLAKELLSRPDSEELQIIYGDVEEESESGPSLLSKAAGMFASVSRFMKAIS